VQEIGRGGESRRTKELEHADVGARPTVDDEVVQDLKDFDRPSREAHDLLFASLALACVLAAGRARALERLPAGLADLAHENLAPDLTDGLEALGIVLGPNCPVNGTREAHAEVDADAAVDRRRHDRGVVGKVKVGEEAERAERKGQDRGDNPLEEPRGKQDGAVAAELCKGAASVRRVSRGSDPPTQPRAFAGRTVTTKSNRCGLFAHMSLVQ